MRFRLPITTHSADPCATPTKELTQSPPPAATPAIQAVVARFTYAPLPAPSNQPLAPTNIGPDPRTQIGLDAGLPLGVCLAIIAVGLLIYYFRRRKSNKGANVKQASTSTPGDPYPPPSELFTQYQTSGQRDKMPASSAAPAPAPLTAADDQILPVTPQKVFVALEKGRNSSPLGTIAELEDGNSWNKHSRVSELYSEVKRFYAELPADSRPAELGNTTKPSTMLIIPRKPVGSPIQKVYVTSGASLGLTKLGVASDTRVVIMS